MDFNLIERKKEAKRISDKKYREKCKLNGVCRKPLTEEQKKKRKEYLLKYNEENKDFIKHGWKLTYKKRKNNGKIDLIKSAINRRRYYERNKEEITKRQRAKYAENIDFEKEKRRNRLLLNQDFIRKRNREYVKKKRETDPVFLVKVRLRRRLSNIFNSFSNKKPCNTKKLIGTDWSTCKKHLECLFKEGMGWENRSEWHIDHIIPLASAKTEEEMIKLCHYTNLQPLWAIENIRKGAKILNNN